MINYNTKLAKVTVGIATALVLTACGTPTQPEDEVHEDSNQIEQSIGDLVKESEGSNDWMELGNKNSGEEMYEDGAEIYYLDGYYSTEGTDEDGFTHVSFEEYDFKYSLVYGDNELGEEVILMFGEAENGTDETIHFNAEMEIATDTQDQSETQMGFEELKSGMKASGYDTLPLDYGKPESFTLTLYPPMKELAEDEYEEFGEQIEMEYALD